MSRMIWLRFCQRPMRKMVAGRNAARLRPPPNIPANKVAPNTSNSDCAAKSQHYVVRPKLSHNHLGVDGWDGLMVAGGVTFWNTVARCSRLLCHCSAGGGSLLRPID